jgi:hypothetical protein
MFLRRGKAKVRDLGGRNVFDFCQTILRHSTDSRFWFKTINVQQSIELTKDNAKKIGERISPHKKIIALTQRG